MKKNTFTMFYLIFDGQKIPSYFSYYVLAQHQKTKHHTWMHNTTNCG